MNIEYVNAHYLILNFDWFMSNSIPNLSLYLLGIFLNGSVPDDWKNYHDSPPLRKKSIHHC